METATDVRPVRDGVKELRGSVKRIRKPVTDPDPTDALRVAGTAIGRTPNWAYFTLRSCTVKLGDCVTAGGIERTIVTDLTDDEIDLAERRAEIHTKLTHCQIALERIQFSENKYILVDGHQITAKPLHIMALLNSVYVGDDPQRKAWVYLLCHR